MLHHVYSVYDNKARAWLPPWTSQNDDTAKRAFAQAANDNGHAFARNANDYVLYHIALFDDATGTLEPAAQHDNLGIAAAFKDHSHGNGTSQPA